MSNEAYSYLDPEEYIRDNYIAMSDSEMGRVIGWSKDKVRRFRIRNGLGRGPVHAASASIDAPNVWDVAWVRGENSNVRLRNTEIKAALDAKAAELIQDNEWTERWVKTSNGSVHLVRKPGVVEYNKVREAFVKEMRDLAPNYKGVSYRPIKNDEAHLLIVDPADIHHGKLSVDGYDAVERYQDGLSGIIRKASGFPLSEIVYVLGNDALHVDNVSNSTTGGTRQDVSAHWSDIFLQARKMHVAGIETLASIAPVKIIDLAGNHDEMASFMLADAVAGWLSNHPNVSFDVKLRPRKYHSFGNSMMVFAHGHGKNDRYLGNIMAQESPDLWVKCKHRYAYIHHLHHKIAFDEVGYTVEYVRSQSAIDRWHDVNGYIAKAAMEGFVHSIDGGQVARLTHWY